MNFGNLQQWWYSHNYLSVLQHISQAYDPVFLKSLFQNEQNRRFKPELL